MEMTLEMHLKELREQIAQEIEAWAAQYEHVLDRDVPKQHYYAANICAGIARGKAKKETKRKVFLVDGPRHNEDFLTFKYDDSNKENKVLGTYVVRQTSNGNFYAVWKN